MIDQEAEERPHFLPVCFCPDLGGTLSFRVEKIQRLSKRGKSIDRWELLGQNYITSLLSDPFSHSNHQSIHVSVSITHPPNSPGPAHTQIGQAVCSLLLKDTDFPCPVCPQGAVLRGVLLTAMTTVQLQHIELTWLIMIHTAQMNKAHLFLNHFPPMSYSVLLNPRCSGLCASL